MDSGTMAVPELTLSIRTERRSSFGHFATYLSNHPSIIVAALPILIILIVTLLAPLAAPQDPYYVSPENRLLPVGSPDYWLGTDALGRDVLSRMIWGGRVSLLAGAVPAISAMVIGASLGLLSGYVGGWLDYILMRCIDIIMAFPFMLLAIALVAALGPSLQNAMLAVIIATVPRNTRLVRGQALSIKEQDFIEAAQAVGCRRLRIMFRHILPNMLAIVIVIVTLDITIMIGATAALSFLGLGVQPPQADWGSIAADGQQYLMVSPHLVLVPSVVLTVVCVCLTVLGDELQNALRHGS
jgi:peptide/nickel transport system permease protein